MLFLFSAKGTFIRRLSSFGLEAKTIQNYQNYLEDKLNYRNAKPIKYCDHIYEEAESIWRWIYYQRGRIIQLGQEHHFLRPYP